MQIPAGFLVDKLGKTCINSGFILFALAALLIAQAQTIGTIYLGSLLAFRMWFFLWLGLLVDVAKHSSSQKSFATAIVNSGSAVGSGLGMILSSYLVAQKDCLGK